MKGLSKEELKGKIFIGEVVDNNDPDKEGRCKIKVFGIYADDNVPVESIPWAQPYGRKMFAGGEDGGFADISVPKVGTYVRVQFADGGIMSPEYTSIQVINPQVKSDISDTYLNSHVVAYDVDEEMKIFYTPGKGLELYLKESHITINPDSSITIEHAQTDSIIELVGTSINIIANSTVNITSNSLIKSESSEVVMNGTSVTKLGPAPTYSAILAEPLFIFLKALAAAVDSKLPATPGSMAAQAAASEQLSTSKNVKLSA